MDYMTRGIINIVFVLTITVLVNSQSLNVHKTDGTVESFILSQIDSIDFSSVFTTGIPCPGIPTLVHGGRVYNTVQIGDQCWIKENLDVGDMILRDQNSSDNGVIEKHCYNDNPANCTTFGGLYQWNEVMEYTAIEGVQGICPTSWHVPTLTEFIILKTRLKNDGNSLKAIGQGIDGGVGTNTSGFSALLAGFRYDNGFFTGVDYTTHFWSSSDYDEIHAWFMELGNHISQVYFYAFSREFSASVRCIK